MITKEIIDKLQFLNLKKIKDWEVEDIRYDDSKKYIFETPFMYLPFGLEKEYSDYVLKLQFKGLKNLDEDIVKFYELIKYFENKIINIKEENKNIFKSQIIQRENYDDLLVIKIKKKFFNINIENTKSEIRNIYDIKKKSKIKCILHIDNLWTNEKISISKFILDQIIIDEET